MRKFEVFLDTLKGDGHDDLIESVKKGYQACFEARRYGERIERREERRRDRYGDRPRRGRRSDVAKELVNKKMNVDVYKLRREVMNYIYRAKNLLRKQGIEMPRIMIRITENDPKSFLANESFILGLGNMWGNKIWIPEMTIVKGYDLHHVVFHELVHALYGMGHDENSKLMTAMVPKKSLGADVIDKEFLKYAGNEMNPSTNF